MRGGCERDALQEMLCGAPAHSLAGSPAASPAASPIASEQRDAHYANRRGDTFRSASG